MVAWSFNINVTYADEMLCVGPQEVGEIEDNDAG
jgi:hypothetical protein